MSFKRRARCQSWWPSSCRMPTFQTSSSWAAMWSSFGAFSLLIAPFSAPTVLPRGISTGKALSTSGPRIEQLSDMMPAMQKLWRGAVITTTRDAIVHTAHATPASCGNTGHRLMASLPIKCPGSDSPQGQLQPVFTKTNLDRATSQGLVRSVKSSVSVVRVTSTTGESQEFPQVNQTRGSAPSHHRLRSLRLRERPRFIFISVSERTAW